MGRLENAMGSVAAGKPPSNTASPLPNHLDSKPIVTRSLQQKTNPNHLPSVAQRYQILTGRKILGHMPAERPWFGYPYAVVNGAQFEAQVSDNPDDRDAFLTEEEGDTANIQNHPGFGLALRVSDDNNMAIEDSDLVNRQPKVFYATQEVVANSNSLLRQGGSRFRLRTVNHALTILTGWWGTKNLYEVQPRLDGDSPDQAPQNCNAIAGRVLGMHGDTLGGEGERIATESAQRIGGISEDNWIGLLRNQDNTEQQLMDYMARRYVRHGSDSVTKSRGANQYARPEVGDAFAIVTIGYGDPVPDERDSVRVRDIRTNQNRLLNWNYHFGGVVARSGGDRVTLENYARGDNRKNNADPRWYFQMFGEKQGQSFHEFYAAKPDYSNPVTIVHKNPNRVEVPWWRAAWEVLEAMSG
jgi:hypothetical protein